MMLPQAAPDGSSVTFRSTGVARYFNAAFLAFWLVFWTIGEAVALTVLALLVFSHFTGPTRASEWASGGASSYVMLFLLVWVTLWTVGGVAAGAALLRSLSGEDRLTAVPEGLAVVRRAGPFRKRKTYERSVLTRVRLRGRDRALVADSAAGTQVLTDLGTREEREAALAWLQGHLRLPSGPPRFDASVPPPGWHVSLDPTGGLRLVKPTPRVRRQQALVMWIVTAITSIGWISPVMNAQAGAMTLAAFALSMLLAAGAAWLTWGRSEWIVRTGSLVFRRQIGSWIRQDRFEPGQLEIEHSTDSDGDDQYTLIVRGPDRTRRISSALHDDAEVVDCARWLEAATGFRLRLPGRLIVATIREP